MLIIFGLVLIAFSAGLVLLNIYPYHPSTLVGWMLLFLLSLPIILSGEYIGERVLGATFVNKLPSWLRIIYGIVIFGAGLAVLVFAKPILEGHLAKWGR